MKGDGGGAIVRLSHDKSQLTLGRALKTKCNLARAGLVSKGRGQNVKGDGEGAVVAFGFLSTWPAQR